MRSFAIMLLWMVSWAGIGLAQPVPPLPSITAIAPSPTILKWDATGFTKFAVYSGPARNAWTNRTVITTNQTIVKPGVIYGVATIDAQGIESMKQYWPSNRIGEIRLKEQGKTNFTTLERFTNAPPEAQKLWRVENVTTGWQ